MTLDAPADALTEEHYERQVELFIGFGYDHVRHIAELGYVGLMDLPFTTGLFVGLDECGYKMSYCYETRDDAIFAVCTWDGHGDPPGPWIVAKGRT